jgi:hypothetical protein
MNHACAQAAEMIVIFGTTIVAGRSPTIGCSKPCHFTDRYKSLQSVVHRRKTDLWYPRSDSLKDLFRSGMVNGAAHLVINRDALWSAPQTGVLKSPTQTIVIAGGGLHRSHQFISAQVQKTRNHPHTGSQSHAGFALYIVRTLDRTVNSLIN